MRHGVKVQIVTLYRVSQLQRYGVTVRGDVTVCAKLPAEIFKWNFSFLKTHCATSFGFNRLRPELSLSAQRCLPRFFYWDFNF
jgi:hypothetical protein